MRIKRLEIQGFKSFKDKTVLHFDHNVTGIVGPNGCGKSNIVDAFFWVMGEQSYKHMRGANSGDLIFNGSSQYQPLGMAEATLVMETDYIDPKEQPAGATAKDIPVHLRAKEVSVTRRVHRTGEGEYFVNGVPARLKDIKELFMDTGVGAKGYSVIEQGQIDKVVAAKPEERRQLIEEAAGIAKYKARKKESLRKMESAESNLARLNDVISEIERNLNSLERQAQKARKYKEYKDELFSKEITWGRRKTKVLREKLVQTSELKETLEQELVGLRAELQTLENEMETARIEQTTESKKIEDLQIEIQELSRELSQEESALELSKRRQEDLIQQMESMKNERSEVSQSLEQDRLDITEKESHLQNAKQEIELVEARVSSLSQEVLELRTSSQNQKTKLNDAKNELMSLVAESSGLVSKEAALKERVESCQSQLTRIEDQKQNIQARFDSAQIKFDTATKESDELNALLENKQSSYEELSSEILQLKESFQKAELEKEQAQNLLAQVRSKLESLEELAAAHEGLGDGPKAILDWAENNGISEFKVLTDFFDVKKGHETALEGWLESRLEGLFGETLSSAQQALSYIRMEKKGRATVQLKGFDTNVKFQTSPDEAKTLFKEMGLEVIGELQSFVDTQESFLNHWLSQVMVVQSLDSLKVSSSWPSGWAVVSLDGMVCEESGVLRGGSTESDSSASLLGRKRAIQELKVQVEVVQKSYDEATHFVSEIKNTLQMKESNAQQLNSEIQQLQMSVAAVRKELDLATQSIEDAESQLYSIDQERQQALKEKQDSEIELSQVAERFSGLNVRKEELESQISEEGALLEGQDENLRMCEENFQQARVEEASLKERFQSTQRELDSARSFLTNRERRLEELESLLSRVEQEKMEHSGGDSSLEGRISELTKTLSMAKDTLSLSRDQLEGLSQTIQTHLSRTKEIHSSTDQKTTEMNQSAIDIERMNGELNHLLENLHEKYGPDCLERALSSAPEQEEMNGAIVTQEMTQEEEKILFEEVEKLRERIRRLGEVNTMAIEEFEEIKKRYDYLQKERSDLMLSIEHLQEAINHINETSKDRFMKAFESISVRFEKLFPIIFGGGRAKLSLIYPEGSDDVLEAGVDILAQPPGKKIVNIGLLSGGEKALTAVSLIFAIFMVKPSPFCLLDEVDAPLDDSNIGKFNALLREMSAKTQFIVITHNKKTMELNDCLYGVTMEEPGVSKMVSIELH
ncbi:MAG: chromosome segregation protein SMC [Bdellovibrionaceae bacterium]|nr:chromosome segregation protein SMC [Pseudobdellovibrionaceae bacterium]|tara:strand:- start:3431 stop:7081 length:3651 start_codon:yes stop_codon:yes gene_type:complete